MWLGRGVGGLDVLGDGDLPHPVDEQADRPAGRTGDGPHVLRRHLFRRGRRHRRLSRPRRVAERGSPASERYFFALLLSGDSSVDSAATKASCGTSTRPTIFIRFLPSFCSSSSWRWGVLPPP